MGRWLCGGKHSEAKDDYDKSEEELNETVP